jgi:hypothetical protein
VTFLGLFFRLTGYEKFSALYGVIGLEGTVTPGDDRGWRIDAEVVGVVGKKGLRIA